MPLRNENAVAGETARIELGKPGPPWTRSRYSSVRRAMGIPKHQRFVYLSGLRAWVQANQHFKEADVYHRPGCKCASCAKKIRKPYVPRKKTPAAGQSES